MQRTGVQFRIGETAVTRPAAAMHLRRYNHAFRTSLRDRFEFGLQPHLNGAASGMERHGFIHFCNLQPLQYEVVEEIGDIVHRETIV